MNLDHIVAILRDMEIEDDDIIDYANEYQSSDYGFSEKFIKRFLKALEDYDE